MGKNRDLKYLGKRIGNIVLHKLLVMHTNRPESKGFLRAEEVTYRDSAIKEAKKHNWNKRDIDFLIENAVSFVIEKKDMKYSDVDFSIEDVKKLVEDEMNKLGLIKS
ncbi:hypothetical protein COU57_01365 [Candidatus Pacearchaeota archaeon CG10_big_fil_rev_8_21_14_0_10_32_14]|nr:MAG: hypothetical protein COU57_01365 [Candidatus Pacearchaeota archaeon CG10_big_fil_rev_8_21_14_0_10_32_14]